MSILDLPKTIVSIDWLSQHINHPNLVILDATISKVTAKNNTQKKENLQIKNARFFDLKNKFRDLSDDLPNTIPSPELFTQEAQHLGIDKDSLIVVYDKMGIYSSPRAWWLFRLMGHQKVAVLDGGFPAWQAANLATETAKLYDGKKGNFEADFQANLVCDTDDIIQTMDNKNDVVLDARSYGRFMATEPEPRAGLRRGHIPNSESLPFSKIVQNGKMLPKEQLMECFQVANNQNKQVLFSCGSGVTACVLALGAEIAGLKDTKVYDGSWTAWVLREDLPIEK